MGNFKYYTPLNRKFDNFSNALRIIKNKNIIVDTVYLEVMEAAELGYCTAWLELLNNFRFGKKGIPKNYKMARYYSDIMIRESTKNTVFKKYPKLKFDSYRASAYLEYDYDNYQTAFSHLIKAAKIMVKLPVEEWDFQIFNMLNSLKSLLANETIN